MLSINPGCLRKTIKFMEVVKLDFGDIVIYKGVISYIGPRPDSDPCRPCPFRGRRCITDMGKFCSNLADDQIFRGFI